MSIKPTLPLSKYFKETQSFVYNFSNRNQCWNSFVWLNKQAKREKNRKKKEQMLSETFYLQYFSWEHELIHRPKHEAL